MNTRIAILALAVFAVGCARRTSQQAATPDRVAPRLPAAALCFDPPVAQDIDAIDLARSERAPVAFVGYEDLIARHFSIRLDDRVLFHDRYTDYDRQALDRKTGVRYR